MQVKEKTNGIWQSIFSPFSTVPGGLEIKRDSLKLLTRNVLTFWIYDSDSCFSFVFFLLFCSVQVQVPGPRSTLLFQGRSILRIAAVLCDVVMPILYLAVAPYLFSDKSWPRNKSTVQFWMEWHIWQVIIFFTKINNVQQLWDQWKKTVSGNITK